MDSDPREEIRVAAQFSAELGNMMGFIDSQWTDRPKRESLANKIDPRKVIRNAVSTDPGYLSVPSDVPIPATADELIPHSSGDAPLPIPIGGEFKRLNSPPLQQRLSNSTTLKDQLPFQQPMRRENDPQMEFESIVSVSNQKPITNITELVEFISKKFNTLELELNHMKGLLIEVRKHVSIISSKKQKQKKIIKDEPKSSS